MEVSQELLKGTIVPMVLKLLSERSMYGYEIIKLVNERTANVFQWKEGTLYPWLHRLEEDGMVDSYWEAGAGDRKRKYYRITPKGLGALQDKVNEWKTFAQAVNSVLLAPACL
jgi:DNA-binding PadR family transcriptional regulator